MTYPSSAFLCIRSLSRDLQLIKISPNYSAIILAYVDLPAPGGPMIRILGGLLGAFDLNFKSSIFFSSAVISALVFGSSAGCSKINWLKAYLTPFIWSSYS